MNHRKKRYGNRYTALVLIGVMFLALFWGTSVVRGEPMETKGVSENQLTRFAARRAADGLQADFFIDGQWEGGYNGRLVLKNMSEETIRNWEIAFTCEDELDNFYHASLVSREGARYTVKNSGYNRDIPAGGTVEFGFGGRWEDEISLPVNFRNLSAVQEVTAGAEVSLVITNQWDGGYCCEIRIENYGEEPLEDWRLSFASEGEIIDLWNGTILSAGDGRYTVRSCDYNTRIAPGSAVAFGFRADGSGDEASLPTDFKLEQNTSVKEPESLYQSAAQADYEALFVGYQENDCEYAVTGNVTLVTEGVFGSAITWSSSNEAIIDEKGNVKRPAQSTEVTLTALIDDGTERLTKEFTLKVIREESRDEEPEQLEYWDIVEMNDPEELQIYGQEDNASIVSYISGKYSRQQIETFGDAGRAIRGIGSMLALQEDDSFVPYIRNTDEIHSTYRFKQFYKGIEVLDHGMIVATDGEGQTTHLLNYSKSGLDLEVEPLPERATADAILAEQYAGCRIGENRLVIAETEEEEAYVLAWNAMIEYEGDTLDVLLRADTGEILRVSSCSMEEAVTISSKDGKIAAEGHRSWKDNKYFARDKGRRIYIYDLCNLSANDLPKAVRVESGSNVFEDAPVYALHHLASVYDYYKTFLDHNSMDGRGMTINAYVNCLDKEDKENDRETNNAYYWKDKVFFGNGRGGIYAKAFDVVAHEYTHGVMYHKTGGGSDVYYKTINEAYADIMAGVIEAQMEGDADWWIHGEDRAANPSIGGRNLKEPSLTGSPSVYKGNNWYPEPTTNNFGEESCFSHINSTVIGHAAYLMQQSTVFDLNALGRLWYDSMGYLGYGRRDFFAVRDAVLSVAKLHGYDRKQIAQIAKAFDQVGIIENRPTYEPYDYVITGRVVEADKDTNIGNNKPLTGYSIKIEGQKGNHIVEKDGAFKIGVQGTWNCRLTFHKTGYEDQSFVVEMKLGKLNYNLGTIEMFPSAAAGKGYGEGKVIDASTGKGVEGLSLTFRKGRYAKYDADSTKCTTAEEGAYVTEELDAGIYCVEVKDERADVPDEERYPKTRFHIKIWGKEKITGQNGYVVPRGGKCYYEGHTYQVFQAGMLWKNAAEFCESLGGHLVTIQDVDENFFVGNTLGEYGIGYAAIGYTDEEKEGEWKWITGEDSDYENWERGEPNNGLNAYLYQNHAFIYGSRMKWDDGADYYEYPFVCEWDAEVEDDA